MCKFVSNIKNALYIIALIISAILIALNMWCYLNEVIQAASMITINVIVAVVVNCCIATFGHRAK